MRQVCSMDMMSLFQQLTKLIPCFANTVDMQCKGMVGSHHRRDRLVLLCQR